MFEIDYATYTWPLLEYIPITQWKCNETTILWWLLIDKICEINPQTHILWLTSESPNFVAFKRR